MLDIDAMCYYSLIAVLRDASLAAKGEAKNFLLRLGAAKGAAASGGCPCTSFTGWHGPRLRAQQRRRAMRRRTGILGCSVLISFSLVLAPPPAEAGRCSHDAVRVGTTCVDKYEASVWDIAAAQKGLIKKVQKGKATLADLLAGGATQYGAASTSSCTGSEYPGTFPVTGNWTAPLYAVSIPGVHPSTCISWFQAEQACALSYKRLLTNQEWQRAAAGTPDPTDGIDDGIAECNVVTAASPVNTGSRSACVSNWGARDMVGNVWEWVGNWGDHALVGCTDWTASGSGIAGDDLSCVGGDGSSVPGLLPGALIRGGDWDEGKQAGVFAVSGDRPPSNTNQFIGFRCAQ